MLFFGEGKKRDKRTNTHRRVGRKREEQANGQTHIGGWVVNVTNGRTHSKNGDGRTDGLTESCFLR